MRLGILGVGSAGRRHGKSARELGYDNIYAFDPSPDAPKHARFIPTFAQRDAVINASEAIIIATPSDRHHLDLADCVAAGKHVLVEKPIGVVGTSASVEKSLAVAKDKGLVVAVGFNLRYHTSVMLAGPRPYFGSFVCCQEATKPSISLIDDWLCHELDLAQYLMGPLRLIDHHIADGSANLVLTNWKTGGWAFVHSDIRAKKWMRRASIVSDEETLEMDFEEDPVIDAHYRRELYDFILMAENPSDEWGPLASGEDGLSVLRICEQVASCALSP